MLAARNLYVLLDEDKLGGAVAMNETLLPTGRCCGGWRHADTISSGANRPGGRRESRCIEPRFLRLTEGEFALVVCAGEHSELSHDAEFSGTAGADYPLEPYPMIAEFRAMLAAFSPKARPPQHWDGEHFFGYLSGAGEGKRVLVPRSSQRDHVRFFRRRVAGGSELFRRAWECRRCGLLGMR